MPTVSWSQRRWNDSRYWDLAADGETWSAHYGGSAAQWLTSIYPRLAPFLPARSIVEIAPGKGRWTQYLLPNCDSYLGVDVSQLCVTSCQERFANCDHARFAVNDGYSLPMVADGSADLVFSFDSLVHAEADVMARYLCEVSRILSRSSGVAFLHHSNLGIYRATAAVRDLAGAAAGLFRPTRAAMRRWGVYDWHSCRGRSETAALFARQAGSAGLTVTGQEVISWMSPLLTDCISVVTAPGSRWDREPVTARNRSFRVAARSSAAYARVYAPPGS